ncbi:transcription factor bHLH162-like [Primulina eburnea]|uniref:transcription factor bHLH162-like n=1 Tax=Primulina eburnea TaxID=1245227 RepID=UPI003C6C560F
MGKPKVSSCSYIHGAAPKIERKVIEKNRRNLLKILYSHLFSLLPTNHTSREALPLPDQIDEAVKYIESMKSKLENMRRKKESLLRRANLRTPELSLTSDHQPTSTRLVEVQDMGPNMDVILASGLADYSMFLAIIHNLLHRDGVEVANANFSVHGSSTIHVHRDKIQKSNSSYGGATTSGGLKELIGGSSSSEVVESQLNVCDYGIESNLWEYLCLPEAFPPAEI